MTTKKVPKKIIALMMARARHIDSNCPAHCRDFTIMRSSAHPDTLILRWKTIAIDNPDRPVQCYRYECFDLDGTPMGCSIHYSNQEEANVFFEGLTELHTQEYSTTL